MKKIMMLVTLLVVLGAGTVFAFHPAIGKPIENLATSDTYLVKFPGLLLDGVYHITEVPYEILYHPYEHIIRKGEYATGLFTGLFAGTTKAFTHLYYATHNILISPIPGQTGIHGDGT